MAASEERERLRRAAFGRHATEADLEALRQFEERQEAREDPGETSMDLVHVVETEEPASPTAHEPPAPLERSPSGVRGWRTRFALVACGIVVGALLGGAIGWFAQYAIAEANRPSLAVFETIQASPEMPGIMAGLDAASFDEEYRGPRVLVVDVRHLATFDTVALYGAIGIDEAQDGSYARVVCFGFEAPDGSGGAGCVPHDAFLARGASLADETWEYRWGPTGGPTRVAVE